MSIKDDINKGFTVGDVTTVKYDDEAKIKVKDYYQLDKLERGKLLELAGQTDIEFAKRDITISNLNEKIIEVENKLSNIGNVGEGGGKEEKAYYTTLSSLTSNTYVFYKFEIEQSELDELGELTLDKYNTLSESDKTSIKQLLSNVGITDPTDLEAIKNELSVYNSQVGGMILKMYSKSIRIPINKEFSFIVSDKLGLSKRAVTSKVVEIVLSKLPTGQYDVTHSTAIGSMTNSKLTSIYSVNAFPPQDIGANVVNVINYLEDGKETNKFGIGVTGSYTNIFEDPYYIGGYEVEKVSWLNRATTNIFYKKSTTVSITISDQNYGDVSKFDLRTVTIGDYEKFLAYSISLRYNADTTGTTEIMSNLLPCYLPYYDSRWSSGVDIVFYGSDGSVGIGQLVGTNSNTVVGKITHLGAKKKGITYTAKFQIRGAFQ